MNPSNDSQCSCVLLVEDDDAVRRSLQLLLYSHGFTVRAYPSAVGLFRDPEALRCTCLVADLIMPNTGALELLPQLREAGWKGGAILISGRLDDSWEVAARAVGFEAVLSKPINDFALVRAVREIMQHPPGSDIPMALPAPAPASDFHTAGR